MYLKDVDRELNRCTNLNMVKLDVATHIDTRDLL